MSPAYSHKLDSKNYIYNDHPVNSIEKSLETRRDIPCSKGSNKSKFIGCKKIKIAQDTIYNLYLGHLLRKIFIAR
jgi:hypothetical protein